MTRKDFELIARTIRELPLSQNDCGQTRVQVANAFADKLQTTNHNFNRDRFIAAASVESEQRRS